MARLHKIGRRMPGALPSQLRAVQSSRGTTGSPAGMTPSSAGRQGYRPYLPGTGPFGRAIGAQQVHAPLFSRGSSMEARRR